MIDYLQPENIKYIGTLPNGYTYNVIEVGFTGRIRIIGVSEDKPPVVFDVSNGGLMEVAID